MTKSAGNFFWKTIFAQHVWKNFNIFVKLLLLFSNIMSWKIYRNSKNLQKNPCTGLSSFIKLQLQPCNVIKRTLCFRCFHMSFGKVLRRVSLRNMWTAASVISNKLMLKTLHEECYGESCSLLSKYHFSVDCISNKITRYQFNA